MRTLAAAVIAGGLLLSGCGGNPAPAPLPTGSASPTPSPSAAAPVLPDAAKTKDEAGAEAFVRHYVDVLNSAQATGDLEALNVLESDGCRSCDSIETSLTDLYSSGGRLEGGAWRVDRVLSTDLPTAESAVVAMVVSFGPQRIYRGTAQSPEQLKGGSLPLTIDLRSVNGSWSVSNWTRGR